MYHTTLKHIAVVCSSVALSLALVPAGAEDMTSAQAATTTTKTMRTAELNIETKNLIGAEVTNQQGDALGKIRNLAIGSDGRISYAVLGTGGVAGMNEQLLAIPWPQLKVSDNGTKVSLDVAKDKLTSDFAAFEDLRKGKSATKQTEDKTERPAGSSTMQ